MSQVVKSLTENLPWLRELIRQHSPSEGFDEVAVEALLETEATGANRRMTPQLRTALQSALLLPFSDLNEFLNNIISEYRRLLPADADPSAHDCLMAIAESTGLVPATDEEPFLVRFMDSACLLRPFWDSQQTDTFTTEIFAFFSKTARNELLILTNSLIEGVPLEAVDGGPVSSFIDTAWSVFQKIGEENWKKLTEIQCRLERDQAMFLQRLEICAEGVVSQNPQLNPECLVGLIKATLTLCEPFQPNLKYLSEHFLASDFLPLFPNASQLASSENFFHFCLASFLLFCINNSTQPDLPFSHAITIDAKEGEPRVQSIQHVNSKREDFSGFLMSENATLSLNLRSAADPYDSPVPSRLQSRLLNDLTPVSINPIPVCPSAGSQPELLHIPSEISEINPQGQAVSPRELSLYSKAMKNLCGFSKTVTALESELTPFAPGPVSPRREELTSEVTSASHSLSTLAQKEKPVEPAPDSLAETTENRAFIQSDSVYANITDQEKTKIMANLKRLFDHYAKLRTPDRVPTKAVAAMVPEELSLDLKEFLFFCQDFGIQLDTNRPKNIEALKVLYRLMTTLSGLNFNKFIKILKHVAKTIYWQQNPPSEQTVTVYPVGGPADAYSVSLMRTTGASGMKKTSNGQEEVQVVDPLAAFVFNKEAEESLFFYFCKALGFDNKLGCEELKRKELANSQTRPLVLPEKKLARKVDPGEDSLIRNYLPRPSSTHKGAPRDGKVFEKLYKDAIYGQTAKKIIESSSKSPKSQAKSRPVSVKKAKVPKLSTYAEKDFARRQMEFLQHMNWEIVNKMSYHELVEQMRSQMGEVALQKQGALLPRPPLGNKENRTGDQPVTSLKGPKVGRGKKSKNKLDPMPFDRKQAFLKYGKGVSQL